MCEQQNGPGGRGLNLLGSFESGAIAVHQPPPPPVCSRPIVCVSGASLFLPTLYPSRFLASHSHVLFLCFLHIPNFCPHSPGLSFLWPPGDLSRALWPCQMLPITVRNMPSISPLILKRLKVQPSSSTAPPQQTCGCPPLPACFT